jgi:hypothetical protein
MNQEPYIFWLRYVLLDHEQYDFRAVYDNELEAQAWFAGVKAVYEHGRPYVVVEYVKEARAE